MHFLLGRPLPKVIYVHFFIQSTWHLPTPRISIFPGIMQSNNDKEQF